ncbi:MAG: hypothetical protein CK533_09185 [Acidobacterium sp.]|nr:hypothetical protein [Acidobacteriota bacterium]PHY10517.1 MAG: hypothetical protein CK533_09185 [Acidobacterium sp.]
MFRRLSLLTTLCLLAAAGVARSTTVIPPSFEALVSSANTIFVGEVMNVRAEWDTTPSGRAIITLVTFRVEEVWKGNLGAVTQLEFLGGEIGELGMKVEGMPVFRLGQRDVLFVSDEVRTVSPLVGFMHGRMRVERDTVSGVDRVRTFDGRALGSVVQIGPQRATPSLASITPMRLSDLASAVRARAAAARQR